MWSLLFPGTLSIGLAQRSKLLPEDDLPRQLAALGLLLVAVTVGHAMAEGTGDGSTGWVQRVGIKVFLGGALGSVTYLMLYDGLEVSPSVAIGCAALVALVVKPIWDQLLQAPRKLVDLGLEIARARLGQPLPPPKEGGEDE